LELVSLPDKICRRRVNVVLLHAFSKKAKQVLIIRFLLELESPAVLHVFLKLFWTVLAHGFKGGFLLLFLNCSVFFILVSSRESLPRKRAFKEVEQDMTNAFQIVSTALLLA